MRSGLVGLAGICFLMAASACGGDPLSPAEQVRSVIEGIEQAAEEGDVSAFKAVISESYEDPYGHDKRSLAAYVTYHVLRHTHRRFFARVRSVEIRDSSRAEDDRQYQDSSHCCSPFNQK